MRYRHSCKNCGRSLGPPRTRCRECAQQIAEKVAATWRRRTVLRDGVRHYVWSKYDEGGAPTVTVAVEADAEADDETSWDGDTSPCDAGLAAAHGPVTSATR